MMANIGLVRESQLSGMMEMIIRPPFMESSTFLVAKNEDEGQSENAPDAIILYSYARKGERFGAKRVGGLWNKTTDNGLEYKSGNIESPAFPNGRLYFALFPVRKEDKKFNGHYYDVIWSPPQQTATASSEGGGQISQIEPETPPVIDDESIPF
jgi:uncharacterized protein (DUF736 family)